MTSSLATPQSSTQSSRESLTSSRNSEATTRNHFLSKDLERAPFTQAQQQPTSTEVSGSTDLSLIRFEQRIFIAGMTRSGKSHLARALFLSTPAPRLVIDPVGSDITSSVVERGATFSDPKKPPDFATIRFIPRDPDDKDAYDAVYRWAFDRYPRYTWLDEAGIAAPAAGYPKALNAYVVQGAKRMLGHLACHTRPREVCRNLISQAMHVFVFMLPNPDDRRYIADLVGVPLAMLDQHLLSLPRYGFLWWNAETQTLAVCDPL